LKKAFRRVNPLEAGSNNRQHLTCLEFQHRSQEKRSGRLPENELPQRAGAQQAAGEKAEAGALKKGG